MKEHSVIKPIQPPVLRAPDGAGTVQQVRVREGLPWPRCPLLTICGGRWASFQVIVPCVRKGKKGTAGDAKTSRSILARNVRKVSGKN